MLTECLHVGFKTIFQIRSSYSIVRFVVFSRNNKVDTIFWRMNNVRYTLTPQCYMIDILLMIVMCRFLRIFQGFDVSLRTSSSSPKWRSLYLLLKLHKANAILEAHLFLEMSWSISENTRTTEKMYFGNTIFRSKLRTY